MSNENDAMRAGYEEYSQSIRKVPPIYDSQAYLCWTAAWQAALNHAAKQGVSTGWQTIETAPNWFSQYSAVIGKLNSDGCWVKVDTASPAWSKSSVIEAGATHWMPIPAAPEATQ